MISKYSPLTYVGGEFILPITRDFITSIHKPMPIKRFDEIKGELFDGKKSYFLGF